MRFEEYYALLKVSDKDKILIGGMDSILLASYIAGRAKREGLNVSVHALINPKSKVRSEMDAVKYAKSNLKKDAKTIADGAAMVAFSVEKTLDYETRGYFNKVRLEADNFDNIVQKLSKINQMTERERLVLLELPFQFFRKVRVVTKHFMGEKTEEMSFRQFLKSAGCQVSQYDAIEKRLFCLFNMAKFNAPTKIEPLGLDEFGSLIRKEILEYILYVRTDALLTIESDDNEYLYFVRGEKTENKPIKCEFVFLDGRGSWIDKKPNINSRDFSVIVLPDTANFRKEFEEKDILIVNKKKAFELYGEEVEPY